MFFHVMFISAAVSLGVLGNDLPRRGVRATAASPARAVYFEETTNEGNALVSYNC